MVGAVAARRIHSGLRALLACAVFAGMVSSLVSPAFAAGGQTGILSGTVTDNATQQPIANATISAASPSGSYNAKTGASGTFTIVGVNVDTYVISVSAPGYDTYVLHTATVTGDQTLALPLALSRTAAVIGRVAARSASGAFQPSQTIDSYTLTGARIAQTTGSPASENLNDVVLSAPGVVLTDAGLPTIRGGSEREIGYQYDGVSFTEPFYGANVGDGLFNGLNSVQVVEGGGDASQGGLGAGVINVIPKRGTNPPFGSFTLQAGGPNFNNFGGGEYGFATADGKLSNYVSIENDRYAPYYGFFGQSSAAYGNYFGYSKISNSQLVDNFVYKFGKDNSQSIQVLYNSLSQLRYGNLGGEPPASDPNALQYYNFDQLSIPSVTNDGLPPPYNNLFAYSALAPYTPATATTPTSPELATTINSRYLKFEYDNNLNDSTFLALRYYNLERLQADSQLYSLGPSQQGLGFWDDIGGPTVGTSFDLTHTFGDKLTVTLNGQFNVLHPIWDWVVPIFGVGSPLFSDFLPPAFFGEAACPPLATIPSGAGYAYCATGGTVQAPAGIINFNNSFFQNYGAGLRFQYAASAKLHLDFGARFEGQNEHWFNPYNPNNVENPFDVLPSNWQASFTSPKIWEPRAAVSYQIDTDDSVRASYGRSAVFLTAQTSGTPAGLYGNLAALAAIPPDLNGVTPVVAGAPLINQCGGNENGVAGTFPCQNYLQQYYWAMDRVEDAPDAGGPQPAVYSNYDASYSHQFGPGGVALKVTPFYKLGTTLPSATLITSVIGGSQIFEEGAKGFNRTTGAEFSITTPDHAFGWSGFLSGTYQNVLQSAPPLSNGEFDGVPQLTVASLQLNDLFRAGFIPPASVRIGGTYNFRNGFSVTPIVQIDSGFPYNEGDLVAAGLGSSSNCNIPAANVPQVNFGCGVPILLGYNNVGGAAVNTNYYDPAYSGGTFNPNIAATRGTPTSNNSGGVTWNANVQFNMTLQYKHGKDTFGAQFIDIGTNGYNGTTPAVNPYYQPVGNGTSGPQTGQNTCVAQYGTARGCANIPTNTYAFTNGAYLLTNGNVGSWQLAPLAPMAVNVFYKRQL
jgi:hypothetical protein